MFGFAELHRAYLDCRRNKRNAISALRFEIDAEQRLFALQEALDARSYRPSPYACFVVQDPKLREVFAAPFHDRVVHHLLVNRLEPRWERRFIHDAWAGRKGKGLHGAVDRVSCFARQVSGNGRNRAWYLKLDIRSMFVSIDRGILYERLRSCVMDEETDWLIRVILTHDPTAGAILRSPLGLIEQIPPHKSLFHALPGKGLPIGNLTSQFFANVYLDALDQYTKRRLGCRHYVRYMDDMVLLHPEREQLQTWQTEITAFVRERLALAIHDRRTRLRPVSDGIDFLGYVIRPGYLLVRRRVLGRMKEALTHAEIALTRRDGQGTILDYRADLLDHLQASLNSYAGHLRHAGAHKALRDMQRRFPFLERYLQRYRYRFESRWRRRGFSNLRGQWYFFRSRFPGIIRLLQIGRFLECFNEDALWLQSALGLKLLPPRKRFKQRCGWPWRERARLLQRIRAAGLPCVLIEETRRRAGRVRERRPQLVMLPGVSQRPNPSLAGYASRTFFLVWGGPVDTHHMPFPGFVVDVASCFAVADECGGC